MTPSQNWILEGQARAQHEQAQAEYEQAQTEHERARATDFVKNLERKMTPSKNRILGSPKSQNSKCFDLGHFEPDITGFLKNL